MPEFAALNEPGVPFLFLFCASALFGSRSASSAPSPHHSAHRPLCRKYNFDISGESNQRNKFVKCFEHYFSGRKFIVYVQLPPPPPPGPLGALFADTLSSHTPHASPTDEMRLKYLILDEGEKCDRALRM